MKQVILADKFSGIYYLYDVYEIPMSKVLSELLSEQTSTGEEIEVDITHCRFGPRVSKVIYEYFGKLKFINNEDDKVLTQILEHNNDLHDLDTVNKNYIKIRYTFSNSKDLHDYIKSLKDIKYLSAHIGTSGVIPEEVKEAMSRIVILISMLFPEKEIFAGDLFPYIFEAFRKSWKRTEYKHSKYIECTSSSTYVVRECIDDEVYVSLDGTYRYIDYVNKFNAIPYEFGTEKLYGVDEYKQVWISCFTDLTSSHKDVKISRMKDFIERGV